MTENKRFEMKDPNCWGYPITDNKTGTVYNCNSNIWMKELVGVLNALNEKNEQLKQEKQAIKNIISKLNNADYYLDSAILDEEIRKIATIVEEEYE